MAEIDAGLSALADAIETAAIGTFIATEDERKRANREMEIRCLQIITQHMGPLRRASLRWLRDIIDQVYLPDADHG